MAAYDLLAAYYDAVTGDSSTESAFIDEVITCYRRTTVTVLEVACGTGNIIAPLAARYQVSGLDISADMLAIARKKLPAKTPLYLADMSAFELGITFDVIICVYHGINHLLDFTAWESFFGCAGRHLNRGGLLIFDMLTIPDLQAMAAMPKIVQEYDDNCLVVRVRASDETAFDWNIEVFGSRRDNGHSLLTGVIRTASFPLGRVRQSLRQEFSSVRKIDSGGSLVDDSETRTWFACTKPGIPAPREPCMAVSETYSYQSGTSQVLHRSR